MNQKTIKKKIRLYMLAFLLAALVVEVIILSYSSKRQVERTSAIILDQVESILSANAQSEKELLNELMVEYVERANAVAYILNNNETAKEDTEELKKIAALTSIDEINLFNDSGVIYAGTHPNYYGLRFDDGDQVAFFKPMLEDRSLTMCQEMTPNTAEAKSMMYAIVWDSTKTYMVQVGIEPVRLLKEFKKHEINEVVNQMPVYDGMNVFISDIKTGDILGTTDKSESGKSIYDSGILSESDNLYLVKQKSIHLNGYRQYCYFKVYGDYIIAVVHSTKANVGSFLVSIGIVLAWLFVAGGIILLIMYKLVNANERINSQKSILSTITDIYYSMHLIDMADYSIESLESNSLMDRVIKNGKNAADMLVSIVNNTISPEYVEATLAFTDLSTLKERLKNKKIISMDAIDRNVGWLRMSFIAMEIDDNNEPSKVIVATQIIDDDKKREEELSLQANRDELTGLYNRRAYEDDMLAYPDVPPEKDFVYAAIDINGLKVVNDNLGHAAGDDMIKGAAECLKRTFGNYGRVYRTGGDEFVSMFFADEEHMKAVLEDLERMTLEWKGELAPSVSLSIGYATKQEFLTETVEEMAKIADKRMYADKSLYYSRKGVDRRGQAAAHTALCNLYTKILKINLTDDSYSIINMDTNEKTAEKGFSDKISEWLKGFAETGHVHEDDMEEYVKKTDINYLKDYFKHDKTSISIFYRRKYEEGYKQVMMEMIPADDFSNTNQSLFLYVKSIDK